MAIEVNGKRYVTLADEFFVNGAKVYAAYANGVQVYPDVYLPASIRIITPPDKTTYSIGDAIDYTGIVVQALDANGRPWNVSDYPNGIIPFDELIFPISNVWDIYPEYVDTSTVTITSLGSMHGVVDWAMAHLGVPYDDRGGLTAIYEAINDVDGVCAVTAYILEFSPESQAPSWWTYGGPIEVRIFTDIRVGDTITLGVPYICVYLDTYATGGKGSIDGADKIYPSRKIDDYSSRPFTGATRAGSGFIVSNINAVPVGGTMPVPVQWAYQGETFETSFDITVNGEDFSSSGGKF